MTMPAELLSAVAAVLAVLMIFYTLSMSAAPAARPRSPPPTGHPTLDRAYRVQMNTVEGRGVLPLLWSATTYLPALAAGGVGLIWSVGRFLYLQRYMAAQGVGFASRHCWEAVG